MEQAEGLLECCSKVAVAKSKSALHPQWSMLKECCKVSAAEEVNPNEGVTRSQCSEGSEPKGSEPNGEQAAGLLRSQRNIKGSAAMST